MSKRTKAAASAASTSQESQPSTHPAPVPVSSAATSDWQAHTRSALAKRPSFGNILSTLTESGEGTDNAAAAVLSNMTRGSNAAGQDKSVDAAQGSGQTAATSSASSANMTAQALFALGQNSQQGTTPVLNSQQIIQLLQQAQASQQGASQNQGQSPSSSQQAAASSPSTSQSQQGAYLAQLPSGQVIYTHPMVMSQLATAQSGESELVKRQKRLEKNRVAAKECRRKKKEYITSLERKILNLEEENTRLKQEVARLKAGETASNGPHPAPEVQ